MIYIIIDVLYLLMILGIYKLRSSTNQTIREMDNGYAFYQQLPDHKKDIYWKKDTRLVIGLMINIGITMQFVFFETYVNLSLSYILMTLVFGLFVSIVIYTILYLRLKKQIMDE